MVVESALRKGKSFAIVSIIVLVVSIIIFLAFLHFINGPPSKSVILYTAVQAVMLLAAYQLATTIFPLLARVTLLDDQIEVKSFPNGKVNSYLWSDIDGYNKRFVPGQKKAEKSILIILKGKRVVEVSSQFTTNVEEVEQALQSKVKFLGVKPYNMLKEMWGRMLWR